MAAVNVNSNLIIEKLKGIDNYSSWKFMMRMILIQEELWECVENKEKDGKKQQKALARIALAVQPSVIPHIRNAMSAHEAWSSLEKAYEDRGLCRRLGLLRTLFATKLDESGSMEIYINKITELSQQLSEIGSPLEDDFVAVIMLSGLTSDFEPLIMAMENSNVKLSSEIVKGKLLQENIRRCDKNETASALYTRKQPRCYRCKKVGHIIKDCPKPAQKKTVKDKTDNSKAFLIALSANIKRGQWYIDSGATGHMCSEKSIMSDVSDEKSIEVSVANGDKLYTAGKGCVKVNLKNGIVKTISNVFYVPNLTTNLLSVSALVNKGFRVVFSSGRCRILDNGTVVATATLCDGVYRLDTIESLSCNLSMKCHVFPSLANPGSVERGEPVARDKSAISAMNADVDSAKVTQQVWHRRLAHLNHRSMELMRKGMVTGISYDNSVVEKCVACVEGKQTRSSFPKASSNRATEVLELVHSDLCGPMPGRSFSGAKYFITFIDDYSRKTFVYFIKNKDEVFEIFKAWKVLVENQTNKKLKKIRTDNGTEYCNSKFQNYLKENGIVHQTTVPYSPEQNGVAERANRSIMEKSRCMLQEATLGTQYWAEAVNTAVYLKNRSPTIAVRDCTPEEKWTNRKVSVSHLIIFGCIAYAHVNNRTKLEPKAKKYIFVGYCEDTKGYRLLDPENPKRCIKARSVTFFENKFSNEICVSDDDNYCKELLTQVTRDESNMTQTSTESLTEENTSCEEHSDDTTLHQHEPRFSTISISDSVNEDSFYTDNASDPTYIPDTEEESSTSCSEQDTDESMAVQLVKETICTNFADEPQTVSEALRAPDADSWIQAMRDEYESFNINKCWTLTDKVNGHTPIKCKWVFKRKLGVNGELIKYKARLVAKGFTQRYGIDYYETFSPVVRYSSIRTLLAIAVEYNMDIQHLDVKTAFLNGDIQEIVYMEQPEGFIMKGSENKVFKLKKAVYGLKQAAKAWYEKINKILCETLKFSKSSLEGCVYFKSIQDKLIVIALYVDDILLLHTSNTQEEVIDIKNKLRSEFEITDLGPAKYILGMRINKDNNKITLDQTNYIEKVLQRFKMEDCKPSTTPMELGVKLEKSVNKNSTEYDYRSLIGSLMYIAVCSRPDITHSVSYLSQFNDCYDETHWKSAKRVLRYLKGSKDFCLNFVKGGISITGYADADWGRCEADRRSYTGYVFQVGKSIVSWESRKQRTVALSSTEAEYMSLSDCCKEALFLRNFLQEILGVLCKATIFNDNQSAQKLCKNSIFHARTKHIDIRHHFIREHICNGSIDVKFLCTKDMLADLFTKPLSKEMHEKFIKQLMLKIM